MGKQIIRLTDQELRQMIEEAVSPSPSEMDGRAYARIHSDSKQAKEEIQKGNAHHIVGDYQQKVVNNDDSLSRAINKDPEVEKHWLQSFEGKKFKFFAQNKLGLYVHVILTFERITKLSLERTILTGDVVCGNQLLIGDEIILNLNRNTVKYHEKGSRYSYTLEIDNRCKALWDDLVNQIRCKFR